MKNLIFILIYICKYIAIMTLYISTFLLLRLLIKSSDPAVPQYTQYVMYIGTGILIYYPTSFLLNYERYHRPKNNNKKININ